MQTNGTRWVSVFTLPITFALAGCGGSTPTPATGNTETHSAPGDSSATPSEVPAATTSSDTAETSKDGATAKETSLEDTSTKEEKTEKASPVDDSRSTEAVSHIIEGERKAFRKCYEDVKKIMPTLRGTVALRIFLDAEGKVKKAWVDDAKSDLASPKVYECIVKHAETLKYPPSSKGLEKEFGYTFGFNNQH